MTLTSLVLAGIRRAPRRYVGLVLLLVVGGAAVTVGTVLGSFATAKAATGVDNGTALRTVTAYNDSTPLTEEVLRRVRALAGVQSADPVISVPVALEENRASITLLPWNPATAAPVVAGTLGPAGGALRPGTVALPATAEGQYLQDLLGQEVRISYTVARTTTSGITASYPARVVAVTDPAYQVDAPNAAYADMGTVLKLAAARAGVPPEQFVGGQGYDRIVVLGATTGSVDGILSGMQGMGLHAVSQAQQLGEVPGVIALIRVVSMILLGALVLVGAIAVTASAHGISEMRRRDIGVLKAFGWTGRRIRTILSAEMGLVCLAGLAAGTAVGLLVSPFIGARLRDVVGPSVVGDLVIPVPLLLAGNVAVLGFFLVVVWAVVGRAARRPVVTILGGV